MLIIQFKWKFSISIHVNGYLCSTYRAVKLLTVHNLTGSSGVEIPTGTFACVTQLYLLQFLFTTGIDTEYFWQNL